MVTSAELNVLTVKQLGSIAKELSIVGWHEMRKEDLIRSLVSKSRSKVGADLIGQSIGKAAKARASKSGVNVKKSPPQNNKPKPLIVKTGADKTSHGEKRSDGQARTKSRAKESAKKREIATTSTVGKSKSDAPLSTEEKQQLRLKRDLGVQAAEGREDRLVLLVRDPYWLHAFWELNSKTVERAKVALGHFWYTSIPVLRLFRLDSDGSTHPRRHYVRDVPIHGGVNNWYLDVLNPPSSFQAELGYLSREKKFYSLVSSNTVQTPQRQIVDDLDKLDGNWRGVADDLGRIYKLSGGDANNSDLRQVFEQQLHRPMSAPLLSRYRASQQGAGTEKTRRNFSFEIDADVIIHGKTDPTVQVTIRNEPIKINADGTFSVRFSIPEKRHVFPIEAEGSDGVETQRVILTMERNTRVLETLFQEHTEDD